MTKTIKKITKIISLILVFAMLIQTSPMVAVAETDNSVCPCSDCSEYDCSCECASESSCTCIQCKRYTATVEDSNGNIVSEQIYDGTKLMKTQNTYSTDGTKILSSVDNAGNSVYYGYNSSGLVNSMTSGDTVVNFTYNSLGQLSQVSQTVSGLLEGNTMSNQYSYADNKISSITHNGFTYNFTYDSYGNQTVVKINDQTYLTNEYGGAENDRLGKINYSNGQSITYSYDANDNITGISYDNGATNAFVYEYDSDNVLTKITDNTAGYIVIYNDSSTEIRKQSDNSLIYSSVFNNDGSETEKIYDTTVNYNYGFSYNQTSGDSVASKTGTSTGTKTDDSVEYDVTNNISLSVTNDWFNRTKKKNISVDTSKTDTSTDETEEFNVTGVYDYTYNDTSTTASTKITSFSSSFYSYDYYYNTTDYFEYDASGNITGIYRYDDDNIKTYVCQYEYDEAGQLVRENNAEINKTITYTYDAGGNIAARKEYDYTTAATLDATGYNKCSTLTYGSEWADIADLYIHIDSENSDNNKAFYFSSDNLGNITSLDDMTLTWKAGRQLDTVSTGDLESETLVSYQYYYNSDGYISRIDAYENNAYSASEQFVWDGEQLVARCSLDSTGIQTVSRLLYDTDGEAYGYVLNEATVYLYRKNLLGDITGLIDGETGDIVAECAYDAYGNLTIINATGLQKLAYLLKMYSSPLLYRGYVYTVLGGQISYYLGSRFYIPKYGRFLNADKHFDTGAGVIGANMFAYCNNNPVMFTDPSGEVAVNMEDVIYTFLGLVLFSVFCAEFDIDVNDYISNCQITFAKWTVNQFEISPDMANILTVVIGGGTSSLVAAALKMSLGGIGAVIVGAIMEYYLNKNETDIFAIPSGNYLYGYFHFSRQDNSTQRISSFIFRSIIYDGNQNNGISALEFCDVVWL